MKYTYPDEDVNKDDIEADVDVPELTFEKLDVADIIERHSKENKSKAMVINHKIYF